jgi:hypothetical protein
LRQTPTYTVILSQGSTVNLVRGFTPTGMMEYWNNEIMGSGIMQCWVDDKICIDDKIKMDNYLLKTNIPIFHHSIIP